MTGANPNQFDTNPDPFADLDTPDDDDGGFDEAAFSATVERLAAENEARSRETEWAPNESEQQDQQSAATNSANAANSAWDDPDSSLLDDRRGVLPDFPIDVLTPAWRDWLEPTAHGAGVRPDHVVVPALGVASSLIGTARRIRVSRSWSEPLTLWTGIIGFSGDRKTPGLNVSLYALDLIEKQNAAANQGARIAYETEKAAANENYKKWKVEREKALSSNPPQPPPIMPADAIAPDEYVEPRLYFTDCTIERAAALLLARPRGVMLIRDELSGLFANMSRYSGGNDRDFWLECWNGRRRIVERVKGSCVVPHLLVGVIGGFQPEKLERALGGDDGMHGRFLYSWPLAPDYKPLTNNVSEVEPEFLNALLILSRLKAEDAEGNLIIKDIWLSDTAIDEFESFRKWIDQAKRALDGREREWFGKGESMVLRLAGTLSYMAWAISMGGAFHDTRKEVDELEPPSIDYSIADLEPLNIADAYARAAIRLWKEYFWPHARAALRQVGLSERHTNARKVLIWLRANPAITEVSVKDVRRVALAHTLDAEATEKLIASLVTAGWLRPKPIPPQEGPGRPARRWLVNPLLYEGAENAENAENT
jgi:hypothetical protein